MNRTNPLLIAGILAAAGSLLAADEYSVDWHVLPGGGGTSSGGSYSLSGTIGQTQSGGSLTGGQYSLVGGFWSLISVVQTPGAPLLTILPSNGQLIISWPTPATNWTLLQNSNLADSGGWQISSYSVSTNNGVSSITIPTPTGNWFFRLSQP